MYKAQNIMPPEAIEEECRRIQTFCESEYNADIPQAVVERAVYLEGYMAISGKMLADAKWHYNQPDIPQAVVERAVYLEGYMAISGKMLADAKWHYNQMLNSKIIGALKEANAARMSATAVNKYVASLCGDLQHLVDWTDRCNRTCTHSLDFARTIISKHKSELDALRYSGSRA